MYLQYHQSLKFAISIARCKPIFIFPYWANTWLKRPPIGCRPLVPGTNESRCFPLVSIANSIQLHSRHKPKTQSPTLHLHRRYQPWLLQPSPQQRCSLASSSRASAGALRRKLYAPWSRVTSDAPLPPSRLVLLPLDAALAVPRARSLRERSMRQPYDSEIITLTHSSLSSGYRARGSPRSSQWP